MPFLCNMANLLSEYGTTVMILWMLLEGIYIHIVITANSLLDDVPQKLCYAVGWGAPLIITAAWAVLTSVGYSSVNVKKSWFGYKREYVYWLLQSMRFAVLVVNLAFLLNVRRIMVLRLKKEVNMAIILVVVFGITYAANIIDIAPLSSGWNISLLYFAAHFLRSFQGLFMTLIHHFFSREIHQLLCKRYEIQLARRYDHRRQTTFDEPRQRTRNPDDLARISSSTWWNRPTTGITTEGRTAAGRAYAMQSRSDLARTSWRNWWKRPSTGIITEIGSFARPTCATESRNTFDLGRISSRNWWRRPSTGIVAEVGPTCAMDRATNTCDLARISSSNWWDRPITGIITEGGSAAGPAYATEVDTTLPRSRRYNEERYEIFEEVELGRN